MYGLALEPLVATGCPNASYAIDPVTVPVPSVTVRSEPSASYSGTSVFRRSSALPYVYAAVHVDPCRSCKIPPGP